ncbi:MAG: HEAT repeat domain-containing protein [Nitrospirales bacterium]
MNVRRNQAGQTHLTAILVLIGSVVAAAVIWNRLHYDTQDFIIEEVVPVAFLILLVTVGIWLAVRTIRARRELKRRKQQLLAKFETESSREKRLNLAFTLVELNDYTLEGLESVAAAMAQLFQSTLKTALGDKQHRIRGMAASALGAIQDKTAVATLLKALEDDHAYVRGCAALALGRLRETEAKDKLAYVMKEDWDQTVRSRAREALERIP